MSHYLCDEASVETQRLYALDRARALAIAGVVLGHSLLSFMETPIGWAIRDESTWLGADFIVWCGHAFVLPLFFLLSGTLAHRAIERSSPLEFLKGRARRVLLPLAVFLLPVSLAINALWDWGRALAARDVVPGAIPHLEGSEFPVMLAHLWFLYYLLIVSVAAVGAHWLAGRIVRRRLTPPAPAVVLPVFVFGALTGVLVWVGKMQPDTPLGFIPNLPVLAYHGLFFAWGWFLHPGTSKGLSLYAARLPVLAGLSAVFLAMSLPDLLSGREATANVGTSLLGFLGSAGFSVALTATVLGLCARGADRPSPIVSLLSRSAYWCYVSHLPLIVLLQIAAFHLSWPGAIEWSLVFGIGYGICIATYSFVARIGVSAPLSGR